MAKSQVKEESEINSEIVELGVVAQKLAENTDAKLQQKKIEEKRRLHSVRLNAGLGQVERDLITGQYVFKVSLQKEPCMHRFVGGDGVAPEVAAIHARQKYMKYFGITGFQGKDTMEIQPVEALPAMEDSSAWPALQLKNLIDGAAADEELAKVGK
jgi:hypothetical protein